MPTFDPGPPAALPPAREFAGIEVVDASEHNLAHVDVFIPRDCIVAFTGVSGSGKSRWPSVPSTPKRNDAFSSPSPRTRAD